MRSTANPLEFEERVVSALRAMKFEFDTDPDGLTIPIHAEGRAVGRLRPVNAGFTPHEVGLLVQWRNENREAFLTWVTSTEESAEKWLREQILPRRDRILFFAETLDGMPFGQIGLTNFDFALKACELDNWIRGKGGLIKGGMMVAIRALMDWVFSFLQADSTYARVFSDNERVIDLHMRNGLRIVKRVPLQRIDEEGLCRWVEVGEDFPGPIEKYLVHLKVARSEYEYMGV